MRMVLALGTLAVLITGGVGAGLAQDAASVVEKRQATMKRMGGDLKTIREFGEGKGDEAKAVAAATDIAQTVRTVPDLFPPRTGMAEFPGKSGAKPAIWTDWDKFLADQKVVIAKADALLGEVKSGNKTAAATGPGDLWDNGCQGCHKSFREKI